MLSQLEALATRLLKWLFIAAVGLVAISILPPLYPTADSCTVGLVVALAMLWALGRYAWHRRRHVDEQDRLNPRRRALPPAPNFGGNRVAVQEGVRPPDQT